MGGGLGRDVTHPQGTAFGVLAGRQDRVQVVLVSLLLVFAGLLHLIHGRLLLALGFLVGDAGGDEHGVVVADKRIGRLLGHLLVQIKFANYIIITAFFIKP